jgi:hypothetical protein
VVLDNYGSDTHPKVRAWLARHPRWTFDFTRTSASWLNAVKGFFAQLTRRHLQRGVFHTATSPITTPTRNRSPGPPTPIPSLPQHTEGTKR